MEHPHLWIGGFIPASVAISNSTGLYEVFRNNGNHGMGKITLSESTLKKEKMLNWVTSIHPSYRLSYNYYMGHYEPGVSAYRAIRIAMNKGRLPENIKTHIHNALSDSKSIFRSIYRKIKGHFKRDFSRSKHITVYRLNPMVEQAPNPESRVFLGSEKDALGQPRINLNWQLTPLDTYTITRAQEILDEELRRAGLGHLVIETEKDSVPRGIHGGWHHMGTTRMHSDPKQGVVDPNCRVHDISNLYIGGASVFPTSGYANPVLTTVALVLRLADHIREIMKR
jgi:choline dehydrogenase-like flavoprotein